MYVINLEIGAFLLSAFCLAYCLTAKRKQYLNFKKDLKSILTDQHFTFLLLITSNLLSSITSVIGVYLVSVESPEIRYVRYLFHALYFVFHATLSLSFALYIMNISGILGGRKKISYVLIVTPYVINEAIILTNRFTSFAFYMDAEDVYHRGILMPLLYALGVLYIFLGFFYFFKYKQAIPKSDSIAVGVFIVIATLGIIVQAIFSQLLVELFCESLACLVLMMLVENKSGHADYLTGLLNRKAFVDDNRRLIETHKKYSILLLKITQFDSIPAKYGQKSSDRMIIDISSYLTNLLPKNNVYRIHQSEFVLMFDEIDYDPNYGISKKLIDRFNQGWDIGAFNIKVDIVISNVRIPDDISSLQQLDEYVSTGFNLGKSGSYILSDEELHILLKNNMYEKALRNAIANNQLEVKYQPIWSATDKKTIAAEALLRVNSSELEGISPEVFIPIAEKTGLIHDIGYFVFEEVCKILTRKEIKNSDLKYIELNLSVYQFDSGDLVEKFEEIRRKYGIETKQLNLEVTESAASGESQNTDEFVEKFHELGYTFSLDDFGTGYSNLVRLMSSKFKNVKIDKTILWDAFETGRRDSLEKMIKFLKSFCIDIVQEGVETKEQLDFVVNIGCNLIQGFYFSKPVSEDEFIKYITNENAKA